MSSLYGDLPAPKVGINPVAPASKILPPPPLKKPSTPIQKPQEGKAALMQPPPKKKPPPIPRALLQKKRLAAVARTPNREGILATAVANRAQPSPLTPSTPTSISDVFLQQPYVANEYNPARPNDYEQYVVEREQRRERERAERKLKEELSIIQKQQPVPAVKMDLNVSGDEAYQRRLRMSQNLAAGGSISSPTASRPEKRRRTLDRCVTDSHTNVVLLQNLVGKGGVDKDLGDETAEECTKFGRVVKCHIVEAQQAPDDEAVRIFVEFSELSGAVRCLTGMQGRYFGGRRVKASYVSETCWTKGEYYP
eukprot:gb/GEZN01011186.1/.p1 GENE.gb/GEZN01011186.1/~~gb/GEZN01011186.1/.p1  ORF type:complete len:309 (+),score=55.87 gb/GEZN01011186.1/:98-1024(+)